MCLSNLTTKKAKTAKEDIVCYKALNTHLFSPYQQYKYELGKKVTIDSPLHINCMDEIANGFHSFKTLKDAQSELKVWNGVPFKIIDIYFAIIP